MLPELLWIAEARKHIGQKEIPGPKSNNWILNLWVTLAPWLGKADDSAVPWCGSFARLCLSAAKLPVPKDWYRAKAYLGLPVKLDRPAYGCLVIFEREGGGHVGFVVGRDQHDNLMVLGGNQGDMVCIRPFKRDRVSGYRWPSTYPAASRFILPLLDSDGKVSSNEA